MPLQFIDCEMRYVSQVTEQLHLEPLKSLDTHLRNCEIELIIADFHCITHIDDHIFWPFKQVKWASDQIKLRNIV